MNKKNNETSRLTENASERIINDIITDKAVFNVPYFQRPYRWTADKKLKLFNKDILSVVDGSNDFHFIGAIIYHRSRSQVIGDPTIVNIIDGQQRITTIFLYLAACVKVLCLNKHFDLAKTLFDSYIIIPGSNNLSSNIKLHSCKQDREQMNLVIDELQSDPEFKKLIKGQRVKKLHTYGESHSIVKKNFDYALHFLTDQFEEGGSDRIQQILNTILYKMSVVQIEVKDPLNGPKIYDSLNSKQEAMTTGDLVRNEIFSKIVDKVPEDVEEIDNNVWQPFYKNFYINGKNYFDSYFFPYGLIKNSNLKKSDVYNYLQEEWTGIENTEEIIEQLKEYQLAFLDLSSGSNKQGHTKEVSKCFKDLYDADIPSSTNPFLMRLSNVIKNKELNERDGIEILKAVESFLVRRAICGFEPTGLHAVFKRLWNDCAHEISVAKVIEAIKKHKTVQWPNVKQFKTAILERSLDKTNVCSFVLKKYDESFGGDRPTNPSWIEHILPEKPDKSWSSVFNSKERESLKGLIGNLLPLSKKINQSVSNKAYSIKRAEYLKKSMFQSPRELAAMYLEWTPTKILERTKTIAEWALKSWKY
jgi:uncharacterized protein with ParB-like and HNH nuclease domain